MWNAIHIRYATPTKARYLTYSFSAVPRKNAIKTEIIASVIHPEIRPTHCRNAEFFPYVREVARDVRFAGPGVIPLKVTNERKLSTI